MQSNSERLGKYAKCWAGIFSGKDKLLLFEITEIVNNIEKELLIPVIRASDCQRYSYAKPSKLTFYPYEENSNKTKIISLEKIQKQFPKAYKFIKSNEKELKSRQDSRKTFGEKDSWYGLVRFGRLSMFRKPKIVSPGEVNSNKFSLDLTGSAFSCTRVFAITIEEEIMDLRFLLGLLNFNLIEFYLHKTASLKQGGYYSYSANVIDAIPINKECIQNQELVIKLVIQFYKLRKPIPKQIQVS